MHSKSWRERLWCLSEAADHVLMGADEAVTPMLVCDLDGSMMTSASTVVDLKSARCGDPDDETRLRKAIGYFPHNERVGSPSLAWLLFVLLPSELWFFVLETSTCCGLVFGCPSSNKKARNGKGDKVEGEDNGRRFQGGCAPTAYKQLMDTGKKGILDMIYEEYGRHSEEAAVRGYQRLVDELLASASAEAVTERQAHLVRHRAFRSSQELITPGLRFSASMHNLINRSQEPPGHDDDSHRTRSSSLRSSSLSSWRTSTIGSLHMSKGSERDNDEFDSPPIAPDSVTAGSSSPVSPVRTMRTLTDRKRFSLWKGPFSGLTSSITRASGVFAGSSGGPAAAQGRERAPTGRPAARSTVVFTM